MSFSARFFLNGDELIGGVPGNFPDASINVNFDQDSPDSEITLTDWRLVNQDAERVLDYIDNGLTGGTGIFEGMDFRAELSDETDTVNFDTFLNLTDTPILSCYDSTIKAVESGSVAWLNEVADGFSFEFLANLPDGAAGKITENDYVFSPYVLNKIPNSTDIFLASLSLYVVQKEFRDATAELSGIIAASSSILSTPGEILRAFVVVTKFIVTLLAVIKLLTELINLLIQPVKYHAAMRVKKLFERGCEYLGKRFESSIFEDENWKDLTIIPEKFNQPFNSKKQLFGFLSPDRTKQTGYYNGTFGDFIREMKTVFKAKVIMDGDVMRFEREDLEVAPAEYTLPDIEQDFFTTNANELKANYLIEFQTDQNDKNTYDNYVGTVAQITTSPKVVNKRENTTLIGYENASIGFARATRKTELTSIEKFVKSALTPIQALANGVLKVVNSIVNIYNKVRKAINSITKVLNLIGVKNKIELKPIPPIPPVNLTGLIENRIGMLMIENDYINAPKLLILRTGTADRYNKVEENNDTIVNAENLWGKFHKVISFVGGGDIEPNQWFIKEIENVPFSFSDYLKIRKNSNIFTPEGGEGRLESVEWNLHELTARIKYRYKRLYTNNLQEQIIIPDGL